MVENCADRFTGGQEVEGQLRREVMHWKQEHLQLCVIPIFPAVLTAESPLKRCLGRTSPPSLVAFDPSL